MVKGIRDYAESFATNDINQTVDKIAYAINEEGYTVPKGGGGVSEAYRSDDIRIEFGHGARKLTGTGMEADYVQRILAKDVLIKGLNIGEQGSFVIIIDGIKIKYSAFKYANDKINIGTFYLID